MAGSYTNIGSLYTSIYEQVEDEGRKSDAIPDSTGTGVSDTLLERVGWWASRNPAKLLDTAMYYQQKALVISRELSDEYGMTFKLYGIASILMIKGEYSHALEYYQQAAQLADSVGALRQESEAHLGLSKCYEQLGKRDGKILHSGGFMGASQLALDHYKQYSTLKDSVFNEEKSKDIGKLEAKHEFEMAAMKQKRAEEEHQRILKEQTERSNLLQYSGIFIVIIAFIITLLFSGKLRIPVRLAEGGIFFTFLLIFEFLLVLSDPYIEQWTGGEPAYKLMVNAALAALILPFHNLAETKIKQRLFKTNKKKILATKTQRHKEIQS